MPASTRRTSNLIYAVVGLGIFGAFTIFDFNRLRRSIPDAVPIAAAIVLDHFNIFLLALELFGGGRRDRKTFGTRSAL
jgi:FtsH-binding integral membrane protein